MKNLFPTAYNWLIQNKIVGFAPFSQLQPWFFLSEQDMFWVHEKWPSSNSLKLLAFAKRQDNDYFSCFAVEDDKVIAVYLIHGWTKDGFEVIFSYPNIWDWLHVVLDDIQEWVEIEE